MWQKIKEWFYQTPERKPEEEVALSCVGVLVPFHWLIWTKHCSVTLFYQQEKKKKKEFYDFLSSFVFSFFI